MLEVGIAFQRKLLRQVYTGNPANNNVGGGYREFPGLDILIGTDKVDRKSTRLNSSHSQISYADFCLKKTPHPQAVSARTFGPALPGGARAAPRGRVCVYSSPSPVWPSPPRWAWVRRLCFLEWPRPPLPPPFPPPAAFPA